MDDTLKFLFGPLMALIPIFVWELAVKPLRSRRNVALVLLAETESNLEEIAYYRVSREKDAEAYLVNLTLLNITYSSFHSSIAELPVQSVSNLMKFYAALRKIDATNLGLESTRARLFVTADAEERKMLETSLDQGLLTLGLQLNKAWSLGESVLINLRDALQDSWIDQPTLATTPERIMLRARERYTTHQAAKTAERAFVDATNAR